jgi:probable glucitol transport protein GutA
MKMRKEKTENPDRLPVGKFFAWKTRDISIAAVTIVTGFVTMFCTDFLGMPAALVGTLLFAGRILDGFTDLVAGFIVDNTKTRWGKGRPYEVCILGAWLCTMLLFFCPPSWSLTVKCIWVFVMYNLVFSIFQTLLAAAQMPYIVRAFGGRRMVIAKLGSYGGIVSMLGSMVVAITFPMVMAKLATSEGGWRNLIMIYAIPLALIGILRFIFVKEDPSIDTGAAGEKVSLKQVLQMMGTNKYAWFFAAIFGFYQFIVGMNAVTYFFKYVLNNIALMGMFAPLAILILPIMFVFPVLMKKMSVSNLIQLFASLAIVGYAVMFFAGSNIPLLMVGGICTSFITLPISYLQAVVIMQLSNYNEWKGLPRLEGTTAVIMNFGGKVLNGAGVGALGILLGAAGYNGALEVQSESAVFMIRSLYSLFPLGCMVIILLFSFALSKLEKMTPQIEQGLKERRAAAETAQA